MEISNLPGWTGLQRSDPTMSSELLLDNAENFGLYLAQTLSLDDTEVVSRKNIGNWNKSYLIILSLLYSQNTDLILKT